MVEKRRKGERARKERGKGGRARKQRKSEEMMGEQGNIGRVRKRRKIEARTGERHRGRVTKRTKRPKRDEIRVLETPNICSLTFQGQTQFFEPLSSGDLLVSSSDSYVPSHASARQVQSLEPLSSGDLLVSSSDSYVLSHASARQTQFLETPSPLEKSLFFFIMKPS
jgi:hypothetical protein